MSKLDKKVRNKKTGEIGVLRLSPLNDGSSTVFALPKYDFEVVGRVIARYKTNKGLWQRWEVVE